MCCPHATCTKQHATSAFVKRLWLCCRMSTPLHPFRSIALQGLVDSADGLLCTSPLKVDELARSAMDKVYCPAHVDVSDLSVAKALQVSAGFLHSGPPFPLPAWSSSRLLKLLKTSNNTAGGSRRLDPCCLYVLWISLFLLELVEQVRPWPISVLHCRLFSVLLKPSTVPNDILAFRL